MPCKISLQFYIMLNGYGGWFIVPEGIYDSVPAEVIRTRS